MLVINPAVGLAYRFPIPSAKTLPTRENTFGFCKPVNRLPIPVLLPTKGAVVPLVPGGVTGTGIIGPRPLGALDPAAVAPSKKKPDLEARTPKDPSTSPLPEHCRPCASRLGAKSPVARVATLAKTIPCLIDGFSP